MENSSGETSVEADCKSWVRKSQVEKGSSFLAQMDTENAKTGKLRVSNSIANERENAVLQREARSCSLTGKTD